MSGNLPIRAPQRLLAIWIREDVVAAALLDSDATESVASRAQRLET